MSVDLDIAAYRAELNRLEDERDGLRERVARLEIALGAANIGFVSVTRKLEAHEALVAEIRRDEAMQGGECQDCGMPGRVEWLLAEFDKALEVEA